MFILIWVNLSLQFLSAANLTIRRRNKTRMRLILVERNDRRAMFSVIPTSAFVMSPHPTMLLLLTTTMITGQRADSSAGDADDARPEITGNLQRDVIDVSASAQPTPEMNTLLAEVLRCADCPNTDGVVTTSSELPLPVILSTSYSERLSGDRCSDVANTCCDDKATDDVTVTSLHLLSGSSMTTKGACSDATTFASSGTQYVGAVCLLSGESVMPTRVGGVLHSAAGLFPFPVPTRISHRAPFIVGGSPVTLSPPARWLPLAPAAPNLPGPSLSLDSPAVIPADYFRKQHVTGCTGVGLPLSVRLPGLRCVSDKFCQSPTRLAPIQSLSVGPPRRTTST